MVSTWTATLQCQALSRLAEGLATARAEPELAARSLRWLPPRGLR